MQVRRYRRSPSRAARARNELCQRAAGGHSTRTDVAALPIDPVRAGAAFHVFRGLFGPLNRRTCVSGLTHAADLQPACTAASAPNNVAVGFFRHWFET